MAGVHGDQGRFAHPAERLGGAPELELGDDAHLVAQFQDGSVALGNGKQVEARRAIDAGGRRGNVGAAQFGQQAHRLLHLFELLGPGRFVVDGPLREVDGAGHLQARSRRSVSGRP